MKTLIRTQQKRLLQHDGSSIIVANSIKTTQSLYSSNENIIQQVHTRQSSECEQDYSNGQP